jgi:hypothetical protein
MISTFKISSAAILTLATPTRLLSNQKIILIILSSFFQIKNVDNIPHTAPLVCQYYTRPIILLPAMIWFRFEAFCHTFY